MPDDWAGQEKPCLRCPNLVRIGNPPPRNGVKPAFVAIVVPLSQLEELAQTSQRNQAVEKKADWSESAVVK